MRLAMYGFAIVFGVAMGYLFDNGVVAYLATLTVLLMSDTLLW